MQTCCVFAYLLLLASRLAVSGVSIATPHFPVQDTTGVECLLELELLYQPLVHPR